MSAIPFPGFTPIIYKPTQVEKKEVLPTLESPEKVMSPMKYHYYEFVPFEKDRVVRNFHRKIVHTLAPGSAVKQAKVIERNYTEIRELRRQLFKLNGKESAKIKVEDAAIEIHKNGELRVEQRGRKRSFGMHETTRADGKKQKRLYPKAGNGVIALSGPKVKTLVDEYNENQPSISFQKFVENTVQRPF